MKKSELVRIGIIASGRGSTGEKVMIAGKKRFLENGEVVLLISTDPNAGCIEKAKKHHIPWTVVAPDRSIKKLCLRNVEWNCRLHEIVKNNNIEILILAGCDYEVFLIEGVIIFNTHPADTIAHGGRHMFGLAVHRHVLNSIRDEIYREMKTVNEQHWTTVNFHEVIEGMDKGKPILQIHVKIPKSIVQKLVSGKMRIREASKRLQKHVLKYEYLILPAAVNILIHEVLMKTKQAGKL